jgi:DNA-binding NarL/FixJ family response regulator
VTAPRVLLAEHDELTRTGLRVTLSRAGFEVVEEVSDAAAAVSAAARRAPDLALLATKLPGGGIAAARDISGRHPGVRVVMLAPEPSGEELVDAILAGASGYLGPDTSRERLALALRGVLDGEVAIPRRHTRQLLDELRGRSSRRAVVEAAAGAAVTDREWEVLLALGEGSASSQIARKLHISEVTVRRHVSALVSKLGVRDRAAAVRLLHERSHL